MKAYLRSARIAPKKANIIAMMVRGMRVQEALTALSKTNKKGARMVETLLKSAVANAEHNDKQHKTDLMIKTIIVNQGTGYQRGTPMARGRMRPMTKFLSHITLTLGIADGVHEEEMQKKQKNQTKQRSGKTEVKASQNAKNPVKDAGSSKAQKTEKQSSESSASSVPSAS